MHKKIGMVHLLFSRLDWPMASIWEYEIDLDDVLEIRLIKNEIDSFANSKFGSNWVSVIENSHRNKDDLERRLQDPIKYMTDEGIEQVAQKLIQRLHLPEERRTNILKV